MRVDGSVSQGQQEARARWGTCEGGAEFDRKKRTFLTAEAREFITQQVMCSMVGPGPAEYPSALLLAGQPGFVEAPDAHTCLIPIARRYEASSCVQGVRVLLASGGISRLALCFMQHVTRQRICVQGEVEVLSESSSETLWLHLRVSLAFFHCPRYIRTRVSGLHIAIDNPLSDHMSSRLVGQEEGNVSAGVRAFLARQVLCYLCTVDHHGQHAINHRGGAAGFLVTLEPDQLLPGDVLLLPDYAGNGAFEAIGNILETGKVALLVPGYAEQLALCIAGEAVVLEPGQLPAFLREKCRGAQRIVAITVRHIEQQDGDWSAALAYERARAQVLAEVKSVTQKCQF